MMRILLALHHRLDPNAGAAGSTLALGAGLSALGCEVEYFGFDEAYGGPTDGVAAAVRFPWRLMNYLRKEARRFDVIDISTGDNWMWAKAGRPGAKPRHALITRSHGLEHAVDRQTRDSARAGELKLSWKYPFYHGGYRLWEVKQSLREADHTFLLNDWDRDFAVSTLGIEPSRISVVPHGIGEHFTIGADTLKPSSTSQPLRIGIVGTWILRKGTTAVVRSMQQLRENGVAFELSIFGSGLPEEQVLASFPAELRSSVRVTPGYKNRELPQLLAGNEIILFLSRSEGFGVALVEAMACGLAPVATPVGVVESIVKDGKNGFVVPVGDADAVTRALLRFHQDRALLLQMRENAVAATMSYRWGPTTSRTLRIFEDVLGAADTSSVARAAATQT